MSIAKLDKTFQIEDGKIVSFWEKNPQLAVLHPFSELYNRDKSKGKQVSSVEGWAVVFYCEPDEDINVFYRFPEQERKVEIEQGLSLPTSIWGDASVMRCIERYPMICLDSVGRGLKEYKDVLERRASFLKTSEYNLETMTQIDNALSKSSKIYEDFDKINKKFLDGRGEGRLRGGREKSLTEKKQI
jgi:hypothetical protein